MLNLKPPRHTPTLRVAANGGLPPSSVSSRRLSTLFESVLRRFPDYHVPDYHVPGLPGLENARHPLQECRAPRRGREVHVIKRDILEAAVRIDQRADVVAHEAPRRIALQGDVAPALAIG